MNITSSLLTVQPTQENLAADLADKIARIAGIARVAPQRIVPALVEGQRVNLIAFDPGNDFSILTWLEDHQSGPIEGLIVGGRLDAPTGTTLSVCGMPLPVHGRLRETGVGPFDESYFLRFETLADIVSFCRASGSDSKSSAKPEQTLPAPLREMGHADVCSPELPLARVSAFLLQLLPGAKPEQVKFSLGQLADVKIVEGNPVLTSSRGALVALLIGIAAFTVLQLVALLMLLSLLFSAIVRERFREIGLLRALGANANQVMTVILAEAGIITGLGGIAGLAFGAAVLAPFSWPAAPVLQIGAIIAILFSAALGVAGALLPAWRVRRTAPHALIHANGS